MNRTTKPVKRKGGRGHSVFKRDYIRMAGPLGREGFTDEMTGDVFGVSSNTIRVWRKKWPSFDCALKGGKDAADRRVVMSLYQRASGYDYEYTDVRVVNGKIIQTSIIKHYPPDVTACIFWLKNRVPDEWGDTQHRRVGGNGENPVEVKVEDDPLKHLSTERLREIVELLPTKLPPDRIFSH